MGNYRAVGRLSTDGGATFSWMSSIGAPDVKFRPRDERHHHHGEHRDEHRARDAGRQETEAADHHDRSDVHADLSLLVLGGE